MIASEQISVLFVKIPFLLLRESGQKPPSRTFSHGCTKSSFRRVSSYCRYAGAENNAVRRTAVLPVPFSAALRCASVVWPLVPPWRILDQAHSMRQKEGSLSLPDMRLCHSFLFWHFLLHYFTAPVIPFAKLFCKHRKMIAVGSVQINTPSISIP